MTQSISSKSYENLIGYYVCIHASSRTSELGVVPALGGSANSLYISIRTVSENVKMQKTFKLLKNIHSITRAGRRRRIT